MDRDLKLLLTAWKYVRVLLALPVAWISWKTGMLAYTSGLLPHEAILMGLWALLLAACAAWVILVLGDRMIAGVQRLREGRRIAELLDNFNYAGHRTIETSKLASLWAGEKERSIENDMVWNIKFRKIKSAVRQGFIERSETGGSTVDHLTDCDLASAAKFFRKRKWLEVKDEDDDIGASVVTNAPKPLNIRKRNNWVTRWRDASPWM